ncbi:MAG: hypothetical protein KJS91_04470, partial [Planctomycetes bacterium]|nr:hypothetical protein [Planctomycetota bacterium]
MKKARAGSFPADMERISNIPVPGTVKVPRYASVPRGKYPPESRQHHPAIGRPRCRQPLGTEVHAWPLFLRENGEDNSIFQDPVNHIYDMIKRIMSKAFFKPFSKIILSRNCNVFLFISKSLNAN